MRGLQSLPEQTCGEEVGAALVLGTTDLTEHKEHRFVMIKMSI